MSAPDEVDLGADQPWRPVPMPGSDQQLDLVRLASPRGRLTIHGRFPAGFERTEAGGYAVAEEFLVLDGELEVGDQRFATGDLVVVPAWFARPGMRSPRGCRVLAWFGGAADFLPASALEACSAAIAVVPTTIAPTGDLVVSVVASWALGAVPDGEGAVEVVAADRGSWRRTSGTPPEPAVHDLVRRER